MPEMESEEALLKLSVKELKQRISSAGGTVPAGPLEKTDLVAALQSALRDPPAKAPEHAATGSTGAPAAASAPAAVDPREKAAKDTKEQEEDLTKLSIGELKKRIIWLKATVPTGAVEKKDLVAALKQALANAPKIAPSAPKAKTSTPPPKAKVEPAKPKPPEDPATAKARKQEEEYFKLTLLSEDKLRDKLEMMGANVPAGDVSKHYLVALVKNAMHCPKAKLIQLPTQGQVEEDPAAAALEAASKAAKAESLARVAEMAKLLQQPEAPAEEAKLEEEKPEPKPRRPEDDGDDISKYSAGELKRRISEYGTHLLVGLSEKSELRAALEKAVSSGPPPPKKEAPPAAPPVPTAPVTLEGDALMAQMAEMEKMAVEAEAAAAAAAEKATEAEVVAEGPLESSSQAAATSIDIGDANATVDAPPKLDAKAAKEAAKAASKERKEARKRRRQQKGGGEIVLSDDDGDCVQMGSGAAVTAIVGDSACIDVLGESSPKRAKTATLPAAPIPVVEKAQGGDDEEDDGDVFI